MRLAWLVGLGSLFGALDWSAAAHAQTPGEAPPAASAFPAEPAASLEKACVPSCRSGFVCIEGQCVSACNPACPEGTRCTSEGECERDGVAAYERQAAERPAQVEPPVEEPAREKVRAAPGARLHDGFYLRLALGFGYLASTREFFAETLGAQRPAPYGGPTKVSHGINGFAQIGGLMAGGTVPGGLVIGAGVWGTNVIAPRVSVDVRTSGRTTHESIETEILSISLLGPFVSWYPNPRQGWHGDLAFGYAYAACDDAYLVYDVLVEPWTNSGWGLLGSFGHDFWVSDEWSIGVQARVTYTHATGDGTFTALVPALAVTGTYH